MYIALIGRDAAQVVALRVPLDAPPLLGRALRMRLLCVSRLARSVTGLEVHLHGLRRRALPVVQGGIDLRKGQGDAELRQHEPRALCALDLEWLLALTACEEFADDHRLLVQVSERPEHLIDIGLRDHERHADTAVEGGRHLAARYPLAPCDPTEHGRQHPSVCLEVRLELLRQNPWDATLQATVRDGCRALQPPAPGQSQDSAGVDPRRCEKHITQGLRAIEGGRFVEGSLLGHRADETEAVGVEARGGQGHDRVSGHHPLPLG
mmetsp:Transcript_133517/g.285496  ORF Transcript_133517/g.285496 Transcript_133517/m.285496 type:complete len:265 (-) Transcript_133517:3170-3964(-)